MPALSTIIKELKMSKRCEITGAQPQTGNNVSHAKNATKRRWEPNLQSKRIYNPESGKWVRVRLTAAAIKSLSKNGMALTKKLLPK
jgi:large subunit ribosomal protein L28